MVRPRGALRKIILNRFGSMRPARPIPKITLVGIPNCCKIALCGMARIRLGVKVDCASGPLA